MASLPAFKRRKSIKAKPRIDYKFFVQPIGQFASRAISALLETYNLPHGDDDIETLHLRNGDKPRVWKISLPAMATLYQSKKGDFTHRRDYFLFRLHPVTDEITPVPETMFEIARPSRPAKEARAEVGQGEHDDWAIEGLKADPGVMYKKY